MVVIIALMLLKFAFAENCSTCLDDSSLLQQTSERFTERHAYMQARNDLNVPIYNVELYHEFGFYPKQSETLEVPVLEPGTKSQPKQITMWTGIGSRLEGDWWQISFDLKCNEVSPVFNDNYTLRMGSRGLKECYLNRHDENGVATVAPYVEPGFRGGSYVGITPASSSPCTTSLYEVGHEKWKTWPTLFDACCHYSQKCRDIESCRHEC
eukprot:TRINITY_DN5136_c0_g1_i3.p1 TRINITY_DN5136_c0_g1~~TRINITY_DN5136_c0_g1_i3.p1  ORF type:complete len:210 (-),score=22.53 TRINITY_DN5136_c0_g1_i3:35-664(-)